MRPDALFLPAPHGGQRFCLHHAPRGAPRANIVYLHPFAEEMNKARRVAALQSRAFAADGCAVLQIDLLGCGDSSGDFGDASWHHWVDDALLAADWLRRRCDAPLWLWGLRAGCLLAADAARRIEGTCSLLWWQASSAGALALQQFLRLKSAGLLLDGKQQGATAALRQRLIEGETVEVAGYRLAPALAAGLERATLAPSHNVDRLEWLELSQRDDGELSPAAQTGLAQWRAAGAAANGRVVRGPAFWQTTEIEEAPQLVAATRALIAEAVPA
jgi:exosortase A-associated hydrolase 2